MALIDRFGRAIRYLRVSVTDRCNYRCGYCRPARDSQVERPEILSLEECARLLGIFIELGVERVRLTGGEPLLRRNLTRLISDLTRLPGLAEISLSTNAHLLERHAREIRAAGVRRVNISLDSLDPAIFAQITRGGDLAAVLRGVDAALAADLRPVKVNMVVMKGLNDHEIPAMVEFARRKGVTLRFIETMPVGQPGQEAVDRYMPAAEILERVRASHGEALIPVCGSRGAGPARYFRLEAAGRPASGEPSGEGVTEVGVISALSQHFCAGCNRMRLTASGELALCLGREDRVDLKTPLRAGAGDAELAELIREAVVNRPEGHAFATSGGAPPEPPRMSELGG